MGKFLTVARRRKPEGEQVAISFKYPLDKYQVLVEGVKEGKLVSISETLRTELDKVVKSLKRKGGKYDTEESEAGAENKDDKGSCPSA